MNTKLGKLYLYTNSIFPGTAGHINMTSFLSISPGKFERKINFKLNPLQVCPIRPREKVKLRRRVDKEGLKMERFPGGGKEPRTSFK